MAVRALERDAQRGPTPQRRPRLRVVGGRARRVPFVKIVLVVIFTVFAVSGLQAYLGQEGLRVSELERRVAEAEERLVLLRARQAQLSSPGRIAEEAAELGLVADPAPTFLRAPVGHPKADDGADELGVHKALTAP